MIRFSILVLTVLAACPALAQDSDAPREDARPYGGPVLIERALHGVHVCTNISDGTRCGEDRWTLTVQNDGTRTLRSFVNQSNFGTQINVVMHADAETFRPIHAFASVYSGGAFFGSGHFAVEGDVLRASVSSPSEYFVETVDLPGTFTLLFHPISLDGGHYGAGFDPDGPAVQMHNLCSLGAAGRSVLCAVNPVRLEFLGKETITVPAGTFVTEHYKFGENTEVWIAGRDRVMIQHEYTVRGSRYQLVELEGEL